MAALTGLFDTALRRVEPAAADKDRAPEAHRAVRAVLEDDDTLVSWGISPVLIGSYRRAVSIRRVKDVDVFCQLPDIPRYVRAGAVLDRFHTVLTEAYGYDADGKPRVRRQARSLQVAFPEFDGLYVDAVPARPAEDETWEIPVRDPTPGSEWQQTNPARLTELSSRMNDTTGGLYVPTVKLLRQTRRALLGKTRPGGLLMEFAAYAAWEGGLVEGANQSECYTSALGGVAELVHDFITFDTPIPDPTLPGQPVRVRATDLQWRIASAKLTAAAQTAAAAAAATDRCWAAKAFRELLGGNEDHPFVFDLPDHCNEDGTRTAAAAPIVAGDRHVPAGNRRFG